MECQSCGIEVEKTRFCTNCTNNLINNTRANRKDVADSSKENSPLDSIPFGKLGLIFGSIIVFIVFTIVFYLMYSKLGITVAVFSGIAFTASAIAGIMFMLIWMEFFIEDCMLALMIFICPIGLILIVKQKPERWLKPYFIHMIAAFIAVMSTMASFKSLPLDYNHPKASTINYRR